MERVPGCGAGQIPWMEKVPRAFFRGSTTNYILRNDTNWRASPRLRLHRQAEALTPGPLSSCFVQGCCRPGLGKGGPCAA